MSSVYPSHSRKYAAPRCLNDSDTAAGERRVCMSELDVPNPWLSVRVPEGSRIKDVVVNTPEWCCFRLLLSFEVWVSDIEGFPTPRSATRCGEMTVVGSTQGRSFPISCGALEGSVVTLLLPGDVRTLAIDDLAVHGWNAVPQMPSVPPPSLLHKPRPSLLGLSPLPLALLELAQPLPPQAHPQFHNVFVGTRIGASLGLVLLALHVFWQCMVECVLATRLKPAQEEGDDEAGEQCTPNSGSKRRLRNNRRAQRKCAVDGVEVLPLGAEFFPVNQ